MYPLNEKVSFSTIPPDAKVEVKNKTCQTPCVLEIEATQDANVNITKAGYQNEIYVLKTDLRSGWYWANIFFWPGFFIDEMDMGYGKFKTDSVLVQMDDLTNPKPKVDLPLEQNESITFFSREKRNFISLEASAGFALNFAMMPMSTPYGVGVFWGAANWDIGVRIWRIIPIYGQGTSRYTAYRQGWYKNKTGSISDKSEPDYELHIHGREKIYGVKLEFANINLQKYFDSLSFRAMYLRQQGSGRFDLKKMEILDENGNRLEKAKETTTQYTDITYSQEQIGVETLAHIGKTFFSSFTTTIPFNMRYQDSRLPQLVESSVFRGSLYNLFYIGLRCGFIF
ncbi:MAG: hypothetical protein A2X86_11950 [Bdellovibrionales bacterium GWA2_49_15]|nr:MAG: hypothetical protein A2X86_11950 [Bdellovibrionales bacterium GWA2_49_15]